MSPNGSYTTLAPRDFQKRYEKQLLNKIHFQKCFSSSVVLTLVFFRLPRTYITFGNGTLHTESFRQQWFVSINELKFLCLTGIRQLAIAALFKVCVGEREGKLKLSHKIDLRVFFII